MNILNSVKFLFGSGSTDNKDNNDHDDYAKAGEYLFVKLIQTLESNIKNNKKINFVGYVDDLACDKHHLIVPDHQESPDRTRTIRDAIVKNKLNDYMLKIDSADLKSVDLTQTHDKKYVKTVTTNGQMNRPTTLPYPSTEVTMSDKGSYDAIMAAAASAISGVDAVCSEQIIDGVLNYDEHKLTRYRAADIRKVFCNIRPPGHHAHHNRGTGFCFMNNVAIAANHALTKHSDVIKKVLIFDWDLHHGDGTEDIFGEKNPNVMYVSFHRGGSGKDRFYPGTGTKPINRMGNVYNFPIGVDETVESYMHKFHNEFLPLAYRFKPDLVMISAGFDSHKDDLYHQLPLDYIHFHEMTKSLMKLADECAGGRLVSVLEGGYTLSVLYRCIVVHLATMIIGY
jgi:acetoin utilization deacetylase AcuC-like enzyme